MAVLNWRHHTLIQALMARGPLKEDDFRKMFAAVSGRNPRDHQKDFNDSLLKINKELSYVQMELRASRNQNDGQVFYGLVNNVSDEQSKLGSKYSVQQITLFKAVMEAILQDVTAQGSISNGEAMNLQLEIQVRVAGASQSQDGPSQGIPALRNFSLAQKQKTIDELVHDKWLCYTPDADIELGARSYLELRSLFHNSGIPPCEVCNEPAVKAKVCKNEECTARIHHYCLTKKFSRSRGEIVCSNCGIQWECIVPKTEALAEENEPDGNESQLHAGSKRKRLRSNTNIEEENVLESQPLAGSRRKRQNASRNSNADTTVGGSSQSNLSVSDSRRITRSSVQR